MTQTNTNTMILYHYAHSTYNLELVCFCCRINNYWHFDSLFEIRFTRTMTISWYVTNAIDWNTHITIAIAMSMHCLYILCRAWKVNKNKKMKKKLNDLTDVYTAHRFFQCWCSSFFSSSAQFYLNNVYFFQWVVTIK